MNELHPVAGTASTTAQAATPAPAPQVHDLDEDEFAHFLEEEKTAPPQQPAQVAPPQQPAQVAPPPPPPPAAPKPIIKFGPEAQRKTHTWKRKTVINGTGACRVKSFRGKYSDQGLEHLDDTINEWLDANPDVEIKFVTSTVDLFEGKTREPALVLNLWY
jgi:hypothetical protein